ncbi:MAG TPA: tetratricopeptide repeat protein [Anaeromyxobacteraceae bacterium]|nr:tetratricopeptide repeat protein [Anaeromyxobacteraceae bacterium]
MIALLLVLSIAAGPPPADLKRARDRFEFGAYAECAGAVRDLLSRHPDLSDADAAEAYKLLGLSEYHLGDRGQARAAFVSLLSHDPDYALDPFFVPPPIVELFDQVKKEHEADLAPLRDRKRQLREQERLAEEARRKLLAEEQARSGPPTKVIRVQDRIYLFNWLPLGAGQFQNGQGAKGTAIAAGEVVLGAVNLGAILFHNQIAEDRSRRCSPSQPAGCSHPPFTDADRRLLDRTDAVKYASAALFWALYAYGVVDAHLNYVPRVETEITPQGGGALKMTWAY